MFSWVTSTVKAIVSVAIGSLAFFGANHASTPVPMVQATSSPAISTTTTIVRPINQSKSSTSTSINSQNEVAQLRQELAQEKSERLKLEEKVTEIQNKIPPPTSTTTGNFGTQIIPNNQVTHIGDMVSLPAPISATGYITKNTLNIESATSLIAASAKFTLHNCYGTDIVYSNIQTALIKSINTNIKNFSYGWDLDLTALMNQYPSTCLMEISIPSNNGPVLTSNSFKFADVPLALNFK